jgi:hypothetical protein
MDFNITAPYWQIFKALPEVTYELRMSKSQQRARRFDRELAYDRDRDLCADAVFSFCILYPMEKQHQQRQLILNNNAKTNKETKAKLYGCCKTAAKSVHCKSR